MQPGGAVFVLGFAGEVTEEQKLQAQLSDRRSWSQQYTADVCSCGRAAG